MRYLRLALVGWGLGALTMTALGEEYLTDVQREMVEKVEGAASFFAEQASVSPLEGAGALGALGVSSLCKAVISPTRPKRLRLLS